MLQMELPSLTTRRLALVSFPIGAAAGRHSRDQQTRFPSQPETHVSYKKNYHWWVSPCTRCTLSDGNVCAPVAISKRKEKMLPLSSPAHRILPGASKERDSTRPVSLLEPPLTFFPVEIFTTCRWCLLFPTCKPQLAVRSAVISEQQLNIEKTNRNCSNQLSVWAENKSLSRICIFPISLLLTVGAVN